MKSLMLLAVALVLVGGVILAQQEPTEETHEIILNAGQGAVVGGSGNIADLLPKKCKDWMIAQVPGNEDDIFVCKAGKWIEYLRKDKLSTQYVKKDSLALACAEADTEIPSPKPESTPPDEKK